MLASTRCSSACVIALAVSALTLAAPAWIAELRAQIKVGTQTVPLYVTVTDSTGRLVPGLVEEDFEVYDNGKIQTLTNFDNKAMPITAVVMLDTSGSMTLLMDLVKQAAEEFLIRMMPEDKGKVGAFNDKLEVKPDAGFPFSNNRDQLIRALNDLDFGYPTRLWDAVEFSILELKAAENRRVVLVFTDGEDTASKTKLGDVVELARTDEVMVYAIGLESEYFNGQSRQRSRPDRGLRRIAEETGGGFFELKKKDELGPTFTRVALELHSQYVMGFSPQNLDGKIHKLEVRVKKPGTTVRARKSYVAGGPSSAPATK
jgi:Ca-activated chloride channel family protein